MNRNALDTDKDLNNFAVINDAGLLTNIFPRYVELVPVLAQDYEIVEFDLGMGAFFSTKG